MHYLQSCRNLIWAMNSLACVTWALALAVTLSLFDLSAGTLMALALFTFLCLGISRIPGKSRQGCGSGKSGRKKKASGN